MTDNTALIAAALSQMAPLLSAIGARLAGAPALSCILSSRRDASSSSEEESYNL